jgi:hypothetical protein
MSLTLELLEVALTRIEDLERALDVPPLVKLGDLVVFDGGPGRTGGYFKIIGWGHPHNGNYGDDFNVLELRLERA